MQISARLTRFARLVVLVENGDLVHRNRLSHRARTGLGVHEVRDGQRGFGLTESLIDGQARVLFPEIEQVGIERLARRGGMHK